MGYSLVVVYEYASCSARINNRGEKGRIEKKPPSCGEERGESAKEVENFPNETIFCPQTTREWRRRRKKGGAARQVCKLENFAWGQACDMWLSILFASHAWLSLSDRRRDCRCIQMIPTSRPRLVSVAARNDRRAESTGFGGLRGSCPARERGRRSRRRTIQRAVRAGCQRATALCGRAGETVLAYCALPPGREQRQRVPCKILRCKAV